MAGRQLSPPLPQPPSDSGDTAAGRCEAKRKEVEESDRVTFNQYWGSFASETSEFL